MYFYNWGMGGRGGDIKYKWVTGTAGRGHRGEQSIRLNPTPTRN